ncbi:MAG TPA: hypothetical protein VI564_06105 [Candidatus Nanoarchaeia archaeon]|nr:hypothetical protein [Candidatus Nanoarchaeia archaeon]
MRINNYAKSALAGILSASLVPALFTERAYSIQIQAEPQIHSKPTPSLDDKLSEIAKTEEKNPDAAIPLYKNIIGENENLADDAIKKLGELYLKLIAKNKNDKHYESEILIFYDDIINNHKKSKHVADAYINSGSFLYRQSGKNYETAVSRIQSGINLSKDNETKSRAYYFLGILEWAQSSKVAKKDKQSHKAKSTEYLNMASQSDPKGYYGEISRNLVKVVNWPEPKVEHQKPKPKTGRHKNH